MTSTNKNVTTTTTTTNSAANVSAMGLNVASVEAASRSRLGNLVFAATAKESPKAFTQVNFDAYNAECSLAAFRGKTDAVYTTLVNLMTCREASGVNPGKDLAAAQQAAKDAMDAFWYTMGTRKPSKAGGRMRPLVSFQYADLALFGECCADVRNKVRAKGVAGKDAETIAVSDAFMAYMVQTAGRVLHGEVLERPSLDDAISLRKAANAERSAKAQESKAENAAKREEAENQKRLEKEAQEAEKKRLMDENDDLKKQVNKLLNNTIDTAAVVRLVMTSHATDEEKAAICNLLQGKTVA